MRLRWYLLLATERFCSCAADFLNVLLDNLLRLVRASLQACHNALEVKM